MNVTVEIDKSGRFVVPKHLRDSMRLVPGTRLLLHVEGETLVIRPEAAASGLYKKQGLWVHHGVSSLTREQVRDLMESGRDEREARITVPETAL